MDPLTPSKIQRLMHFAEGSAYSMSGKRLLINPADCRRSGTPVAMKSKEDGTEDKSSGLLDLDQLQGFGESDIGAMSKSTSFRPGEITGRSTGADDVSKTRHSCFNMESLTNELNKQTFEVQDIMRHSIASNYSFHSKCLTADEASLVARNAPLPTQPTHTNFPESSMMNTSEASVGAYFRNRCPELKKVLAQTESPNRSSMQPSLTEVSYITEAEKHCYKLDPSLDSVPVRQPRNPPADQVLAPQAAERVVNTDRVPPTKKENVQPFKIPNMPNFDPQLKSAVPDIRKMAPARGTDLFMKAVTHSSMKVLNDESSITENSLSISKIAEILGNQSTTQSVNISDIISQYSKNPSKRLPEPKKKQELSVTYLKDVRNVESASSSGSVQTVLSVSKPSVYSNNATIPEVVITQHSLTRTEASVDPEVKGEYAGTKTSSTNSRSTLSTVHENNPGSPLQTSKGEGRTSHIPSPNIEYKELDKSVDWHDVMQQKSRRHQGLAKVSEAWAEITSTPVSGFVGVTCAASVSIMTLTDSWLTATFNFDTDPNLAMDLRIDLPRQPILLSPGKTEQMQIHITPNAEMNAVLPFTISLKDSSIDTEIEHKGSLAVDFKMPVVQAMSLDGINKVAFPPIPEKTFLTKTFVLISDSPVDLQLSLSVVGGNTFAIKNVQEIKTSEVNRVLKEQQSAAERVLSTKMKQKALSKQLCRLTRGNAIRAAVTFEAPSLSDRTSMKPESFSGAICVNLIGVERTIKKVELTAAVGVAALTFSAPDNKLLVTKELTTLNVRNSGSIAGVWLINKKIDERNYFNISDSRLELAPGEMSSLALSYTGPDDCINIRPLIFEELTTGYKITIELSGGAEKPRQFPIKTNGHSLSWIRSGRKELSLKNTSDRKVQIRCQVLGEAFTIDMPGVDARGTCCIINFSPNECRPLPIVYSPNNFMPNAADLHLMLDKNSEYSRKISLYGCSGGDALRWCGLATYGETALVRAVPRCNVDLRLTNRSPMHAFVAARVHFNLQYMSIAASCRLEGAQRVVGARGAHGVSLRVDWARVERRARDARAPTLATLTALTGPELTRRRILRILRSEGNGEVDASLLPENLRILVDPFEGEDESMDALLADFHETKASLVELIGGLQELKAQIDLPQDIAEETIIYLDDTVAEHHTLYEK